MQTTTIEPPKPGASGLQFGQSLIAMLALVGARQMDVEALRERTRLAPAPFGILLGWLQREYFVDVVSRLEGNQVVERVVLTEKGESVLVGMLEQTCELPELH